MDADAVFLIRKCSSLHGSAERSLDLDDLLLVQENMGICSKEEESLKLVDLGQTGCLLDWKECYPLWVRNLLREGFRETPGALLILVSHYKQEFLSKAQHTQLKNPKQWLGNFVGRSLLVSELLKDLFLLELQHHLL